MTAASRFTMGAHSKRHTQRGGGSRGGSPLLRFWGLLVMRYVLCVMRYVLPITRYPYPYPPVPIRRWLPLAWARLWRRVGSVD